MNNQPRRNHSVKAQPLVHEVEPSVFCQLVVSSRRLVRQDNLQQGKRGLMDVDTGEQFVIDQRLLRRFVDHGTATA